MEQHLWIVGEFIDQTDSVWTSHDFAISRAAELDAGNGCEDYSWISEFITNTPEGYVC